MKKRQPKLGRLQLEILQVLWTHGELPARQITDILDRTNPVAHSTVQTMLRVLQEKGLVSHRSEDRVFIFRAECAQGDVAGSLARDLVTRVFDGSVYKLMCQLVEEEKIPADELQRIRTLLDNRQRE